LNFNEKDVNYKVLLLFKIYNFYFGGFFHTKPFEKLKKKSISNYFYGTAT